MEIEIVVYAELSIVKNGKIFMGYLYTSGGRLPILENIY